MGLKNTAMKFFWSDEMEEQQNQEIDFGEQQDIPVRVC